MREVASVSGAPTYQSPSDICLGSCCSTTSAYLVTVEFLLCSVSKCEIEMLLFTVQDTFQAPVHDALRYFKVIIPFFAFRLLLSHW